MHWPLLFGLFVLAIVILKAVRPFAPRCPQCGARRPNDGAPLCSQCGWIYELPGDDDDDYGDAEDADDPAVC